MSDGERSRQRPRSGSFGAIVTGAGVRSARRNAPVVDGQSAEPETMRAARRRWASGIAVVTTRDGDGYRGLTVSAFTVVSLAPPLVLVCLDRAGRLAAAAPATDAFAVSLLDRSQEFLADRFAGRGPVPDAQFRGIPHRLVGSGCPVLDRALAWLDCRVHAVHDGGDHLIVVGAVVALGLGEDTDDPLLTYEGGYRTLEEA